MALGGAEGETTLTYRYTASGQRTYKKPEGSEATRYVRDGSATLAVVEGGSLKHWTLTLPGGEVIGRVGSGGSSRRYYLKDHLGSIRAVLDGGGGVRETRDYYPFGLPMPGRYEEGSPPTQEDYTGHLKDNSTQLHYAGARYYSAAFGRWTTTDRFADKYPSLSPYQYAANNPANIIDVNGDSVWVVDGNKRFLYMEGAEYEGDSEYISEVVSNLDTISSVESGSKVLSTLVESKDNYNILNKKPTSEKVSKSDKVLQFKGKKGGGADIFAKALSKMSEGLAVQSAAHELFHGYQSEIGQDLGTAFSEVGARLFGPSIRVQDMGGTVSFPGTSTRAGTKYTTAMAQLFYGDNFSRRAYRRASNNFEKGSLSGYMYPNHPTGPIPSDPAISSFYPLFSY